MKRLFGSTSPAVFAGGLLVAGSAAAQDTTTDRGPLRFSIDGVYAVQADTDLDDGSGEFAVNRFFIRGAVAYQIGADASVGLAFSYGELDYDFGLDGPALWGDIEDYAISAFAQFATDGPTILIAPSLQYSFENGADESDGEYYGLFLGATWKINERLTIGPGLGVFSDVGEDDDANLFPIIIVDWDITDRWTLSTGPTLGASEGPGLTLSYAWNDDLSLAVSGRYEERRFALDDRGLAPGGVGENESFPVFLSATYEPNPALAVSAFVGAELNGSLSLEDRAGNTVYSEDYDPAPFFGIAGRLRF